MKSLWNRMGTSSTSTKKQGPSEEEVQRQLSQAQACLAKLRAAIGEDFPLLNESTRLVQKLDALVSSMPDGDLRLVWQQQLKELQADLKASTEKMLSQETAAFPAAETAGGNMFEGLSMDPPMPRSTTNEDNIFSGLNLGGLGSASSGIQQPAPAARSIPSKDVHDAPQGVSSGPLPEDLFSGLEDIMSSSSAAEPTAAVSDPFATQSPHLGRRASVSATASEAQNGLLHTPGSSADVSLERASALSSADAKRKKKITRRVGVGRDREPPPSRTLVPAGSGDGAQEAAAVAAIRPSSAVQRSSRKPQERATHERRPAPRQVQADSGSAPVPVSPLLDDMTKLEAPKPMASAAPAVDLLGALEAPQFGQASTGQASEPVGKPEINSKHAVEVPVPSSAPKATDDLATVARTEQAAKQERRRLRAEISKLKKEVQRMQAAEAEAVEAEDFDRAGSLSSRLDELQKQLAHLQQSAKAAEQSIQTAVSERWQASKKQAVELQSAAERLQSQRKEQAASSERALQEASQTTQRIERLRASAEERVEELRACISARKRWLAEEEASVGRKIQEATEPVAAQQEQQAAAVDQLLAEVSALRAALAEKEARLTEAQSALHSTEDKVRLLASKFDKSTSRLAEDRRQLAAEEAELEEEKWKAQGEEDELATVREEVTARAQRLQEQASKSQLEAADLMRKAAVLECQTAAEQQAWSIQKDLHAEHEAAVASLEAVQGSLEEARTAIRDLIATRASLHASAVAADEKAAAARRRQPEVEADKKAAAAARDFKEAARLSAEAKALASTAQTSEEEAASLRSQATAVEAEEQAGIEDVKQKEAQLADAEQGTAFARWRLLKAIKVGATQQLEAALEAEAFSEAEALQAEVAEASQEAASLASSHAFIEADAQPEPLPGAAESGEQQHLSAKEHKGEAMPSRPSKSPVSEAEAKGQPGPTQDPKATPRWSVDISEGIALSSEAVHSSSNGGYGHAQAAAPTSPQPATEEDMAAREPAHPGKSAASATGLPLRQPQADADLPLGSTTGHLEDASIPAEFLALQPATPRVSVGVNLDQVDHIPGEAMPLSVPASTAQNSSPAMLAAEEKPFHTMADEAESSRVIQHCSRKLGATDLLFAEEELSIEGPSAANSDAAGLHQMPNPSGQGIQIMSPATLQNTGDTAGKEYSSVNSPMEHRGEPSGMPQSSRGMTEAQELQPANGNESGNANLFAGLSFG